MTPKSTNHDGQDGRIGGEDNTRRTNGWTLPTAQPTDAGKRDRSATSGPSLAPEVAAESALDLDTIFEALKNSRRRHVLAYLATADGSVALGDVAEHIAARENDKEVHGITSAERKRVYVGLYQCHLPKMDDTGIVDFDQPRGTIERGENFQVVTSHLDWATHDETLWTKIKATLSKPLARIVGSDAETARQGTDER